MSDDLALVAVAPSEERKSDKLYYLPSLGFDLCKFMVANRPLKQEEIDDGIQRLKKFAEDNDIPIDGIVMTYNDIAYSKTCGRTGHHYKDGRKAAFSASKSLGRMNASPVTTNRLL